jgi:hypothetical protein
MRLELLDGGDGGADQRLERSGRPGLGEGSSAAIRRSLGFDNRFRHFLGVAKQHHGVVAIE